MNKFLFQQCFLFLSVFFFLFSFVYTEEIVVQTWENIISWNQTDWVLDFTWIIDQNQVFIPFLRFEEIFPKDTLYYWEYLLISSKQNFSWIIGIGWAWTSSTEKQITVTLEANKPCIFTDRPELFWTWDGQCLYFISSMTLTDSGEPLEIREWTNLHHKIMYTGSSDTIPLHWWWIINELWYELFSLSLPFWVVSAKNIWTWVVSSWINVIATWENTFSGNNQQTWSTLTGDWIQIPWTEGNNSQSPPFQIEEIYPFDNDFAEYVEIVSLQNRKGEITLQWWWQWSASKTFFVDTFSGVRRIITDDKNRFT